MGFGRPALAAFAAASVVSTAAAQPVPAEPQLIVAVPESPVAGKILLPRDTAVRLMVLNEVNTHKHRPGHRFVLRVDEAVKVGDEVLVPVGATAWGEVTEVRKNKGLGKAGEIGARLLHIDAGESTIPLSGEESSKGIAGGDRVAFAVVAFGVLGLLARGSQGKLKAGHIVNAYVASDLVYDPETGSFTALEAPAPAESPQP